MIKSGSVVLKRPRKITTALLLSTAISTLLSWGENSAQAAPILTSTIGSGTRGTVNGPAATAQFNGPTGLGFDPLGNVLVADFNGNTIRKITNINGTPTVSTFAGTAGMFGFFNGTRATSTFAEPISIVVDPNNNVYVLELGNSDVRFIPSDPNQNVSTFAGTGAFGFVNGPKALAQFRFPEGIAQDSKGSIYVADYNNNAIRLIQSGIVTTFAGMGPPP